MDRIRNQKLREVRSCPLSTKMCEDRLKWFGLVKRKVIDASMRMIVKSKKN